MIDTTTPISNVTYNGTAIPLAATGSGKYLHHVLAWNSMGQNVSFDYISSKSTANTTIAEIAADIQDSYGTSTNFNTLQASGYIRSGSSYNPVKTVSAPDTTRLQVVSTKITTTTESIMINGVSHTFITSTVNEEVYSNMTSVSGGLLVDNVMAL